MMAFFRDVLANSVYNRSTVDRLTEVCLGIMTNTDSPNPFLSGDEVARRLNRRLRMKVVFDYLLVNSSI